MSGSESSASPVWRLFTHTESCPLAWQCAGETLLSLLSLHSVDFDEIRFSRNVQGRAAGNDDLLTGLYVSGITRSIDRHPNHVIHRITWQDWQWNHAPTKRQKIQNGFIRRCRDNRLLGAETSHPAGRGSRPRWSNDRGGAYFFRNRVTRPADCIIGVRCQRNAFEFRLLE